ncbi:MAG: gliding motility-associated C-terminal domain-containing protein [Aureispira sp.]
MNNQTTKILLHSCRLILLLLISFSAQATHIVGGEMNYRCLGNDRYEISLTIFRDCDSGVPFFDSPAFIGIYVGQSNNLFTRVNMIFNPGVNDTLDISLPDSCLRVTSSACIHTTTYVDTVILPFNPAGYTVAYQRCCRNIGIVNILAPSQAGATYWTFISSQALQVCNSSAVFSEWPPVYLCSGVPIALDQSAFDADGDSLVYEMCVPSDGDFLLTARPSPANPPPYPTITWASPYSTNNMLGGLDPLRINPSTGLLEGTPRATGVFLVGLCIKEYRNGILISETRRDFQHIVGVCSDQTVASFEAVKPPCNNNLLYGLRNTSNVSRGAYRWTIDTLGTRNIPNPSFNFPDTGLYTITLIAGLGTPCLDTFQQTINVQLEAVNLAAIPPTSACTGDTVTLRANNRNEGFSDSTIYTWSPAGAILTGQGTRTVQVVVTQNISIGVTALNSFGCSDFTTTQINVQDNQANFNFTLPPCDSTLDVVFQNQSSSTPINSNYRWTFDTLGTATSTNAAFSFPDTGVYRVSLIAGSGSLCPDTISQLVNVQIQAVQLQRLPNVTYCLGDTFSLKVINQLASFTNFTNYNWRSIVPPNTGQGTDSTTWTANSSYTIRLSATNSYGCQDSFLMTVTTLEVEAAFDTLDLACNTSLNIPFVNNSNSNFSPLGYEWSFDALGTSTVANPSFSFPDTGSYAIQLIAGVGSLCPDTVALDLYLPLYGVDLQPLLASTICEGDSVWLRVEDALSAYSNSIQYTWSPSSIVNSMQGIDSILVLPNTTTTIQVRAINSHLCEDSTAVLITVNKAEAAFDTLDLVCNTSLMVPLVNASTSNFAPLMYEWTIPTVTTSTSSDPTIIFPDTGNYTIQLIAGAGSLCPDTLEVPIYIALEGVSLSAPDDTVFCKGDTIELTVTNALDNYTDTVIYSWLPSASIISGANKDTALAFIQTDQTYTVIGLNSHGCRDTTRAIGRILYPSPVLNITASADSIFVGQQVDLLATNDATYSYDWRPDTTLSSYTIYDPTARPRQNNYYYLLVENTLGCTTLDSILIIIKEPTCGLPVVFIPNAFSPDGDGHNDELLVNGNNITSMTLSIYNRWGERVFETKDQNIGWDGRFKDSILPPDVYGYYLQCVCDDGSTLRTKGNITLLR